MSRPIIKKESNVDKEDIILLPADSGLCPQKKPNEMIPYYFRTSVLCNEMIPYYFRTSVLYPDKSVRV